MKKDNFTLYRLLAAACFALRAVYQIYVCYDMLSIEDYAFVGVYIGLALTFLWGQKAVLLCVTILSATYNAASWFLNLYGELTGNVRSYYLLQVASLLYALAFVMLAVTLIIARKNKRNIYSLWFLPTALFLASTVIYIFVFDYIFPAQYGMEMQWLLPEILRDAIEACGFAFAGLWLKEGVSRSTNTSVDTASAANTDASPLTDSKQ